MVKTVYIVEGLGCANCAAKMERGISGLEGVDRCSLNFLTGKLTLEADENKTGAIIEAAKKIAQRIEPGVTLRKIP